MRACVRACVRVCVGVVKVYGENAVCHDCTKYSDYNLLEKQQQQHQQQQKVGPETPSQLKKHLTLLLASGQFPGDYWPKQPCAFT